MTTQLFVASHYQVCYFILIQHSTEPSTPVLIPLAAAAERANLEPVRSSELFSEKLPDDEEMDGKFAFKRRPFIKYHMVSAVCLLLMFARVVCY